MNKSRPVYDRLRLDPAGRVHLIVTDLAELPDEILAMEPAFASIECWIVALSAPGIQAPETETIRAFRAVADMYMHLRHRLARERAGFRLYALGSEGFLWDVMNLARAAGLGSDEVFLSHSGSLRRRVYCAHCKTIIENVTTNIVDCPACGAHLFVRDHFSRRLAAFMGVAVDAEVPGEVPEIEVLYP